MKEQTAVHPIVKELQAKYAPDKRTAIFAISVGERKNDIVLKGEVQYSEAKSELVKRFKSQYKNIIDSIEVLPSEDLGSKKFGIITVSVANMRNDPKESAELGSQVLMGTIVKIWKKKNGYAYIQSPDTYLGWVDTDQLYRVTEKEAEQWRKVKKVFVKEFSEIIHEQPNANSFPVSDVVGGSVLKHIGGDAQWIKVGIADGREGYIKKSSVIDFHDWGTVLCPVPDNIERTGKFLMGVPYLWGGTSVKGVDCSGFTKTVFLLNGQLLNRDANQQAEQGVDIEPGKNFQNLRKGDLLFFGKKEGNGKAERIVHVGIYLGDRVFIHSSGKVQLSSFNPDSKLYDEYNLRRFVRARRVIASVSEVKEVK